MVYTDALGSGDRDKRSGHVHSPANQPSALSASGVDLEAAAGQYSGLYDDLDARTRPSTWSERSVKTFVTVGIIGDMLLRISQIH